MLNQELVKLAEYGMQKRSFVPPGADQGMPPSGMPPGPPGMPPGALPVDPSATGAPPFGMPPMPTGPLPMDPAMLGGAPPPGGPPMPDPSMAGAAPPAPPAPPPPPPMDANAVRSIVQEVLAEQGGAGGKGKATAKVDPAQIYAVSLRNQKMLANIHSALGLPLPPDILDEPVPAGDQSQAQGSSGGGEEKALQKSAIEPLTPLQGAFPKTAHLAKLAEAVQVLLRQRA